MTEKKCGFSPKDLLINGRSLADIEQEEKKLKADFEDFVGSTIKTLQILIVNDKQKQKKIDALEKALADFMAQIIKGEIKMKFKQVLFNIVVYAMLGWSIISAVHAALPEQYQIPEFTNMVALISGSSTALVGSAGLFIKSWLAKASTTADYRNNRRSIYEKFLILEYLKDGLKGQLRRKQKT